MGAQGIPSSNLVIMLTICFVFCGTFSTVMSKIMYQTSGIGLDGEEEPFAKPLFQNWAMFLGMSGCLLLYELTKKRPGSGTLEERTSIQTGDVVGVDPRVYYYSIVPATCDFIATYLMAVGLLYINASIWQMIRGSLVFFSALIRWRFLGENIASYQWFGIVIVMTALCIIGFACIQSESATSTSTPMQKAMGIALVFVAQIVQATQTVIEEHLLKNVKAPDIMIVGLEGFWGLIICTGIALPFCQFSNIQGIAEDSWDTAYLLYHNPLCLVEAFVYVAVILGFNIFAMKLTNALNSVTRNILDTLRTVFIWTILTVVHYTISRAYGENWTNWSFLQLFGFFVLISGLFTYYRVFELPFFSYPDMDQDDERELAVTLTPSTRKKMSAVGHSPYMSPHM